MTPKSSSSERLQVIEATQFLLVPELIARAFLSRAPLFVLLHGYLALKLAATDQHVEHPIASLGALGWSANYARRVVRMLGRLGVIVIEPTGPQRGDRRVVLLTQFSSKVRRALVAVRDERLQIDLKAESIIAVKTGDEIDLSVTPIHVLPQRTSMFSSGEPYEKSCSPTENINVLPQRTSEMESSAAVPSTCVSETSEKPAEGITRPIYVSSSTLNTTTQSNIDTAGNSPPISKLKRGRPPYVHPWGEEPAVDEVWTFWRDTLYPKRTAPTSDDASRLRCRLRDDGATIEELKAIVLWAKSDPWMNGTDQQNRARKRYDSIQVLFNSRDKFEKYRDQAAQATLRPPVDARGISRDLGMSDKPVTAIRF